MLERFHSLILWVNEQAGDHVFEMHCTPLDDTRHSSNFTCHSLTVSHSLQPITKLINPRLRGTIVFFWFLGWIRFLSTSMHTEIYFWKAHMAFVFASVQLIPVTRKLKTSFTWITISRSSSSRARISGSKYMRATQKKTGTEITHTLTHDLQKLLAISF